MVGLATSTTDEFIGLPEVGYHPATIPIWTGPCWY